MDCGEMGGWGVRRLGRWEDGKMGGWEDGRLGRWMSRVGKMFVWRRNMRVEIAKG
jgi:hypothetical protein